MRELRFSRWAMAAALTLAAASSIEAQWLKYPTPGVPKTSDGKADLSAPAPRTRDGKPDLSGLWEPLHNRPCPPEGCNDMVVPQEFLNIGWSIKGGLPYQPWAADLVRQRTAENRLQDPNSFCLPTGVVRMHTTPLLRKVIQTPGLLVILNERETMYRQIFTDGRPFPPDPQPSWSGYSTGAWEGDTLVIRTIGFRDGLWLDANGSPLSEDATITERFRRPNFGTMDVEITVEDLKAYTRPWAVTLRQTIVLDTDLLDYICKENERSTRHFVGK